MSEASMDVDKQSTQSRNVMIFILVMSMSGLENLIAELMPELEIGLLEVGISTFYFVPFSLVILFGTWWAALAVPIGEIVFSDLILGEFGGLSEFEEVFLVTVALIIAARIARDPSDRRKVFIAALVGYFIAEMAATFVDIAKVWVGVEELEAVEGLPESIVVLEGIDFLIEYVISGFLLGALLAPGLTARLYGKIEPLMGLEPRKSSDDPPGGSAGTVAIVAIIGILLAGVVAIIAEAGINPGEWEPEFLDVLGDWFIYIPIAVSAAVIAVILAVRAGKKKA